MTEGTGVYFEDHKESSDLGRLALRGGTISVAMQYGNGVLQIVAAVVLARLLGAGGFWISRDRHGSDELRSIANRFWPRRRHSAEKQDNSKPGQQPVLAQ